MTITCIIKGPYRFAGFFWVDVNCGGKPDAQYRGTGKGHLCWDGGGMTDQILLLNAARAAGIGLVLCYETARNCLKIGTRDSSTRWRPLTHSDDALALAVSIPSLDIKWIIAEAWQTHADQPSRLAYVCRKIVDIAAEFGRGDT